MIEKFCKELLDYDVSAYTETRKIGDKEYTFIPWYKLHILLRELGANEVRVNYETNADGYPAFYSPNGDHPFVRVNVQIDALRFTYDYPVINGEFSFALPRALDIHVAQQRAFVKAVAVHTGLGLRLWEKDEDVPLIPDGGLNLQLTIKLGEKVGKYGSPAAVLTGLGTTKAEMDALIKGADIEAKKAMLEKIIAL